jgi:N-acetyl-gamma-glutamylphosphate reductase
VLKKYFEKKYKVIVHDECKPIINEKMNFYSDIKKFFSKSDVIFLCYKNKIFKQIEKMPSNKKKLIIDLWNYFKIYKNNVIVKKIGVS